MTTEQIHQSLSHLPAIGIFVRTLAIWAFYGLYAMFGVVMAIDFLLGLLHKLLGWITGRAR